MPSGTLLLLPATALAQEGFSLFTTDFPPEEFAARRAEVYKAIGENGLALLQGAPSPAGYTRFRQSNEFYYLCGIEIPHAYLLLDGSMKRASLYLPHRNEARERGEGKLLSAEDAELVKNLSGVNEVFGTDLLVEHLARATRISGRAIFTPFSPAEGFAMSRDLAVRVIGDYASAAELARREHQNESYVCRILRLTLLAPDIVESILDGTQPQTLELKAIMKPLPVEWKAQRRVLK